MTDALDTMTKEELADFASVRGFEIDGRWSAQRMREAIRAEMAKDAANVAALSEAMTTDMVTFEAGDADLSALPMAEPAAAADDGEAGEVAPATAESGEPVPAVPDRVEIHPPAEHQALNLDAIVWEWAEGFCDQPKRATAVLDGAFLTVEVVTRHGVTSDIEPVACDDAASIKAALAIIKARMTGEQAD